MTDRFPGIKFAVFAVLCIVAAIWLISVTGNLRRIPFLQPAGVYEAVLPDIAGLVEGDDVRLAGVPVGRVRGIDVERGLAVVTFEMDPEIPITDTWGTAVRWKNVIGQRYLYIHPADGGSRLADGARIPVERARRTADIGRFFNEITPLLRALDPQEQNVLLGALNDALVGREGDVQDLVRDLGSLSATVADQESEIRTVLREGGALLGEYNAREEELSAFLTDLSSVGETLVARNDELIGAVQDIGTVQAELASLLDRNDEAIRGNVDNIEVILDSIRRNRDDFAQTVGTARDGLATYMLISRWGQWFNVRIVAAQAMQGDRVLYCQTEGGSACSEPNTGGVAPLPLEEQNRATDPGVGPGEQAEETSQGESTGTRSSGASRGRSVETLALAAMRGGER
jgi:phospholipid/cholesterol/gamma-HCH transport system substrate-binding protein